MEQILDLRGRVRDFVGQALPALHDAQAVLAASGGADSTALVALLCDAGVVDPARVVIAHFDHRLRSAEASRADAVAVQELARRYGIEAVFGAWASPRRSEGAAREARYEFLRAVAERCGCVAAVTGHTADDQAETILMHATRGAGLHGLAGMAPDAPWPDGRTRLRVWRPLLDLRRAETRAYCDASGLAFVEDASNEDRAWLRNRLRRDVLPRLSTDGGETAHAALIAIGAAARRAATALDAIAAGALKENAADGIAVLDRRGVAALQRSAVPHAFRLALVRLLGDAREFERKHYRLMEQAVSAATGARYQLPRGVELNVDARELTLSRGPLGRDGIDQGFERALPFDGVAGAWAVRVLAARDARMAHGGVELRLPEGAVVRGRRAGDRVRTPMGGKKLSDWYIDRKIPRRQRESAPVIGYGNQVLWTPWGAIGEAPHGRAWRIVCHPARAAGDGSTSMSVD
jgi:tRNA(Ile)-lysidine synthase